MNPFKLINLHGIIFSDEEKNLIDLEIQKMFQKGAIRRTSFDPRQFICLPFELSSAPRVFTNVLKPFVVSIRNKGIRLVTISMIWPLSAPLVNFLPKRLLLLFKS